MGTSTKNIFEMVTPIPSISFIGTWVTVSSNALPFLGLFLPKRVTRYLFWVNKKGNATIKMLLEKVTCC